LGPAVVAEDQARAVAAAQVGAAAREPAGACGKPESRGRLQAGVAKVVGPEAAEPVAVVLVVEVPAAELAKAVAVGPGAVQAVALAALADLAVEAEPGAVPAVERAAEVGPEAEQAVVPAVAANPESG